MIFRLEIVYVVDKCYGVMFYNKMSMIDCVRMEDVFNFVDG